MYKLLKPLFFSFDPEFAHDSVVKFCSLFPKSAPFLGRKDCAIDLGLRVGQNKWSFPVGLAAGLDKNGSCYEFFNGLGFGAVEVGTVTPLAQAGNPKPRMFRYVSEESLRNCMGFNNDGDQLLLNNLAGRTLGVPLGINIGKNKSTPDQTAYEDYSILYDKFKNEADYIAINVSSPNTPGLRSHQTKEGLEEILANLNRTVGEVDLFVKISPDLKNDEISDIVEVVKKHQITGIIATNTTIDEKRGPGGISGKLLFEKARLVRQQCLNELRETPEIEFIGVGGFSNYEQMLEYWKAGGRALQIYSSFIFQGPKILKDIQSSLILSMNELGVDNFEDFLRVLKKN